MNPLSIPVTLTHFSTRSSSLASTCSFPSAAFHRTAFPPPQKLCAWSCWNPLHHGHWRNHRQAELPSDLHDSAFPSCRGHRPRAGRQQQSPQRQTEGAKCNHDPLHHSVPLSAHQVSDLPDDSLHLPVSSEVTVLNLANLMIKYNFRTKALAVFTVFR